MVASTVAESIHNVSPSSRLAFQQLDHETFLYSGPDWKPVHQSLFQQTGFPTGARLEMDITVTISPDKCSRKRSVSPGKSHCFPRVSNRSAPKSKVSLTTPSGKHRKAWRWRVLSILRGMQQPFLCRDLL